MKFVQARHYTAVATARPVDLVVIHSMEAPERANTALAVAFWFSGKNAPRASAHYCIDATEVVGCVHERDVAWAAPGANGNGIQLEHAGFAAQGAADWADAYSEQVLARSAALCAEICKRHSIPVVKLTVPEVKAGRRGICGHIEVTRAFNRSTHTDPGAHFPWGRYLELVEIALSVLAVPAAEPERRAN